MFFNRFGNNETIKSLKPGDLLIVEGYQPNKESKAKLLAIDENSGSKIFSLKIFSADIPEYIETPVKDKTGKPIRVEVSGIGHIPLTETTLSRWKIRRIGWEEVKESELHGYNMWKSDSGIGF